MSNYILPLIVLFIIAYGLMHKVDIYSSFIEGAKEVFPMILSMFPCMLAMIFGVNIFMKSEIVPSLLKNITPILNKWNLPFEIITLGLLRPVSSSSTLAILNSILTKYGPDHFISNLASIIQGSTDTTLYILSLYFGSVGIKKIRYSLLAGLVADLFGFLAAILIANLFF